MEIKYDILKTSRLFSNLSVTHAKNVCHSLNDMQHFCLYIQVITNMFWLFPTAILVNIINPYNFDNFLSFLNCIYTPFKKCLKKQNWMSVIHKIRVLISNYFFFFFSLNLPSFSSIHVLDPLSNQCMPQILKIWQKI